MQQEIGLMMGSVGFYISLSILLIVSLSLYLSIYLFNFLGLMVYLYISLSVLIIDSLSFSISIRMGKWAFANYCPITFLAQVLIVFQYLPIIAMRSLKIFLCVQKGSFICWFRTCSWATACTRRGRGWDPVGPHSRSTRILEIWPENFYMSYEHMHFK